MRRWMLNFAVPIGIVGGLLFQVVTADEIRPTSREALRRIVQEQCVPSFLERRDPTPCERVYLRDPSDIASGFAVLADRKGGAHFLLIPTTTITGIESADAAAPTAINYFAAAWEAGELLQSKTGYPVPRFAVGLAVNSQRARGQDQLHIHIECLGKEVFETLHAHIDSIGDAWSSIDIAGSPFIARRVTGETLASTNPFTLLASHLMETSDAIGSYTLLVAGVESKHGFEFVILAGKKGPNGESLLDSTCAISR